MLNKQKLNRKWRHGVRMPINAMRKLQYQQLFSTQEAAAYLGVCTKTLKTQTLQGKVPYLKLGRIYKYRRIALDELLGQLEIKPVFPAGPNGH